ncbi:MAG: hypothetical protein WBV46_17955 [Terriglobales bacterium]|jgi:hypothetical protein
MLALYRCLQYLYPANFRREYSDEMTSVFRQARAVGQAGNLLARISFYMREISG